MFATSATGRALTEIRRSRAKEFRCTGVQLGYRYSGSPICVPDGSPEPPDEPDEYVPSTWHSWSRVSRTRRLWCRPRPLVLVRPDGHVGWRGRQAPADPVAVLDMLRGATLPSPDGEAAAGQAESAGVGTHLS
ncbi:hypothetical protein ASD08_43430 [Streptomyces sp. Root369]|nr:hypothetical protein ASD08_43430 [Streptomyces sp. Root369]